MLIMGLADFLSPADSVDHQLWPDLRDHRFALCSLVSSNETADRKLYHGDHRRARRNIRYRHSHLAMHSRCVYLGQIHPRRPLHQAERNFRGLYRSHRGLDLYSILPARSNHIASAHGLHQEMGSGLYIFLWPFVSHEWRVQKLVDHC